MYDQYGTGGADNQWLTVTLWLYNVGWGEWNFGRAAALAWILFLIILAIGVINLFITRSLVRDEGRRDARSVARDPRPGARRQERPGTGCRGRGPRPRRRHARRRPPGHHRQRGGGPMTAVNAAPVPIADPDLPAKPRRRPRAVRGSRPAGSCTPRSARCCSRACSRSYWSLLIGSGDSSTIRDANRSWIPGATSSPTPRPSWATGGQLLAGAGELHHQLGPDRGIRVFFSTLAGWAFAKLKFRGGPWLLVFVVATMAVPTQLGVVPLYILFSELEVGQPARSAAIIIPALTSAFGVFWMTQYLRQAVPDELIEAARVDGASSFRSFLTVGVPAARPAAAMLALFTFVSACGTTSSGRSSCSTARTRRCRWRCRSCSPTTSSTTPSCSRACCCRRSRLLLLLVFAGKQMVSGSCKGGSRDDACATKDPIHVPHPAFPRASSSVRRPPRTRSRERRSEDGRTASIWDAFSRVPDAVINADNGDVACDHYHRYADDVQVMKSLGLQTYRFSTSWSRVRPDGGALNPRGVDFYKRLVDELLDAGILPWLTLYHWDLPQALEDRGGWAVRETSDLFTEYALDMHDASATV